jgi:hypothetical protein
VKQFKNLKLCKGNESRYMIGMLRLFDGTEALIFLKK